jgi:benzoylformate decarboxylase
VLGDVGAGLASLATLVRRRDPPAPALRAAPPEPGMTQAYVLSRIAALRPAGSVLVEEAPTARGAMHDHLPVTSIGGFYTTASGGLGYGLPAAVGVARANPARKVIALLGDGSAMYTIQALWSAAQQRANLSVVVLNNRRYAALDSFAKVFGIDSLPGTEIGRIDFVALAQGHGVPAQRVSDVAELDAALQASFASAGPSLIELLVD